MHDKLLFFNIQETEKENTTDIIHKLLEEKMEMEDAARKVKIDRSHRLGKPRRGSGKAQPKVVKLNFHQDKQHIRLNARKLKGTVKRYRF
jgi:hypothetical protein